MFYAEPESDVSLGDWGPHEIPVLFLDSWLLRYIWTLEWKIS